MTNIRYSPSSERWTRDPDSTNTLTVLLDSQGNVFLRFTTAELLGFDPAQYDETSRYPYDQVAAALNRLGFAKIPDDDWADA